MKFTADALLAKIGKLTLEVDLLVEQNTQLSEVVAQLRENDEQQTKAKNGSKEISVTSST
jgi:hypothetical protein